MDKIASKVRQLISEDSDLMVATLLATMLGTTLASFFLSWATMGVSELDWVYRLAASLGATLVYGGTAAVIFYVLLPKSREAFKKVWQRQK